jgi:hypothetical protein
VSKQNPPPLSMQPAMGALGSGLLIAMVWLYHAAADGSCDGIDANYPCE